MKHCTDNPGEVSEYAETALRLHTVPQLTIVLKMETLGAERRVLSLS